MKKRLLSLLLMLVMCVTLISPSQVKEVQAAEKAPINTWVITDLIYGDTYGIYPQTWYENDLTGAITPSKLRELLYGVRKKIIFSNCAKEKRFAWPTLDKSITVAETLEAFYTVLSNYDYTVDLGFNSGLDPVTHMKQIGVYTGQNGELGLDELCSTEQAMVIATRIITTYYDALDASSKGFLWEVKAGENTVYLLGSIHVASTQIYPFSNEMLKAYFSSNALITEANLYDQADVTAFTQLMYYTDGTTLKDHVSADTYKKAIETAALIGVPEEIAASIKPWALQQTFESTAITIAIGNDKVSGQLGIDMNFLTNAYYYQKPIDTIESLEKQGKILDGFSEGLQDYLLSDASTSLSDIMKGTGEVSAADLDEYMDSLYKAWETGDVDAFKKLMAEDEWDAFAGELSAEVKAYEEEQQLKGMTQRDDAMAVYIDNLLKAEGSNTYFVVLGSAHFISDYSVIDRLAKLGYKATQVK